MSFKLKHLRGYPEEWTESRFVPEDGEIALVRQPDGSYRMKIGNGSMKFSELTAIDREVVNSPGATDVTPKNRQDVRVETVSTLTVSIPYPLVEDYESRVSFKAGSDMRLIIRANDRVYFSAMAVTNNQFTPRANARYTLFFWCDGGIRCRIEEGLE